MDYLVVGANTDTNGDGNPNPIAGGDDTLTVKNGASIDAIGTNLGVAFDGGGNNQVTNNGTVTTQGTGARGLVILNSANSVLLNNGTATTQGTNAHGMVFANSQGAKLSNAGTIRTFGDTAYGMINYSSANATFENTGLIETDNETSFGMFNDTSNDVLIRNSGVVNTNGEGAYGIYNRDSTGVTIANTGSIRVSGNRSTGIRTELAATLTNSGLIFAAMPSETAIEMSGGDDVVTLKAGTRFQGLVNLNGGTDNLTLDHRGSDIGWRFTFDDFDAVSDALIVNGAPFVVENPGTTGAGSTTVTIADLSREANAGAVLNDINAVVRGAATARISQAWAMTESGEVKLDDLNAPSAWNFWAKAIGSDQRRGATGLSAATRHSIGGVLVGADLAQTHSTLFGAFGGFAKSRLQFEDQSQNASGAPDINSNSLFGGAYGRIEAAHGLFADGIVTLGYVDGDADERLRANNLVTGGVETISGGDASGFFAASSLTLGANIPAGEAAAMLIPSLMLSQATQWRKGYSESETGAQSIQDYLATVLSARLQLAAQIHRITPSGISLAATVRGGVEAEKDVSQDVELTMLGESFSVEAASDAAQIGGFLGADITIAKSNRLSLTLEGEFTFAGYNADELGGKLNAGIQAKF